MLTVYAETGATLSQNFKFLFLDVCITYVSICHLGQADLNSVMVPLECSYNRKDEEKEKIGKSTVVVISTKYGLYNKNMVGWER